MIKRCCLSASFRPAYDKSRQWGGQILNYEMAPQPVFEQHVGPGVLKSQKTRCSAQEFKPTLLTGQVFAGLVAVRHCDRAASTPSQSEPMCVVVAYEYDYSRGARCYRSMAALMAKRHLLRSSFTENHRTARLEAEFFLR